MVIASSCCVAGNDRIRACRLHPHCRFRVTFGSAHPTMTVVVVVDTVSVLTRLRFLVGRVILVVHILNDQALVVAFGKSLKGFGIASRPSPCLGSEGARCNRP
jgi:hypothetical protein